MKKLQQTLMSLLAIMAPLAIVPFAAADSTCQNGYTGPDSKNICTSITTFECTVKNDNTVTVNNDNTQITVTGDASSSGNTTAGGAKTGSATNSNGVTFNATVTNKGLCTAVATVPATVTSTSTPTPTPVTPGRGAVATTPVVAPGKGAAPAVLADTAGDNTMSYVVGAIAALGAAIAASRFALATYGRMKL